jgi:site-specific DNA recombinase
MIQVALYVRVSTRGQQQTQTIDQQLARLRTHVATQPDCQLNESHIYRDDGYSGAKLNRPGLDRLRDQARAAQFTHVLITAPDRLARNYVHQVLLINELKELGCTVEFVDRPMSDDPHDQLLLQIRGAVAEYERTLIADRMRRGRQMRVRCGQLLPWVKAPYGYIQDAERPRDPQGVRVDPVAAAIVEQIFAAFTDPQHPASLYRVAKQLSDAGIPTPNNQSRWNVSTIRGILRSPVYTGQAMYGRTRPVAARRRKSALQPIGSGVSTQPTPPDDWISIPVPAIISQEQFDLAQTRLNQNKQLSRRNNTAHDYLLRGLVSCGRCQLTCTGRQVHPDYHYYVCAGRTNTLRAVQGERCFARYIPAQALDELVWQDLCQVLREPALLRHELLRAQAGEWLPQALQAQRKTIQQALAQLERQQERLLEVYLAEVIGRDEFERKRQELSQTQHGLQTQLRQLDAQAQQHLDLMGLADGLSAFCQRIAPTLEGLDFTQRRQLVELLIDRVVVTDGAVEIRYVVPTGPNGEAIPFCHLRLDYFDMHALEIVAQHPPISVQIRHHHTQLRRTLGSRSCPGDGKIALPIGLEREPNSW